MGVPQRTVFQPVELMSNLSVLKRS